VTSPTSKVARRFLRAAVVLIVAVASYPVGTALAAPPGVTIERPLNGRPANDQTPSFSGLAEAGGGEVTLRIYAGLYAAGTVIQEASTAIVSGSGTWSLGPAEPLKVGFYTAQANQTNLTSETGTSAPVTFTVNSDSAKPPTVTLNPLTQPSSDTTPSFTGTASDTTPVTVQIHAGATAKGAVVSLATAAGGGSGWTSGTASPALSTGQYTAVAIQESSVPSTPACRSEPVTFTVTSPSGAPLGSPAGVPAAAPPAASFRWFPAVPKTGEAVSLVSTSTDASSPISGIAWALTSNGPFQGGGPVLTTAFSTNGAHVVRLRVTNADGVSSIATETINVVGPSVPVMQPFPVVRIVGAETPSGVKLKLLEVLQTPAGSSITLRCRGHGCPIKSSRRVAVSSNGEARPVRFRAVKRLLRFGVTLEILVSKAGQIGKYTRLAIRRGKLPERVDMCLDPAGRKPLVCPSS